MYLSSPTKRGSFRACHRLRSRLHADVRTVSLTDSSIRDAHSCSHQQQAESKLSKSSIEPAVTFEPFIPDTGQTGAAQYTKSTCALKCQMITAHSTFVLLGLTLVVCAGKCGGPIRQWPSSSRWVMSSGTGATITGGSSMAGTPNAKQKRTGCCRCVLTSCQV